MATNVTFNGVTYSVPTTAGESGWATTLSAYLQALASGAATTSTVKQAIRTATASPVTVVAATDYTVVTNLTVPGAVAVNLPAGVAKQVFVIVDGKGDAATNAITIDGNGAETINGAANYVINENNGGVILQFSGTGWVALADFVGKDPTFTSVTVTSLRVSGLGLGIAHVDASGNFTSSAIVNADVSASAAIAYSKLNLATSIVNADISASANIVDSKLNTISTSGKVANSATTATSVNTAFAIVQRDGSGDFAAGTITATAVAATSGTVGGVAITTASNTQALTNKTFDADGTGNSITNIENADIKAGAAIARAKLASGSNSHVVINDGSGVMSSEAQLAKVRGGTGADNSSVTFPASGTLVTEAGSQTLTNKTITSAELDTPLIDDYFDINEESAPGTPAAGKVRVYAKSDAKLYKKDDNGVEQEIGAGGSGGGVNYIANPLFADGTVTGWATYADAAGTTPVDGTGGSPNVTFTAVSGATVRGTYAGRLTKDAANRQGQGASYAFTIDAADTGRPVSIAFDFLASAAYVANDVGVYLYDVTNSTLITPAAINVAAGKGAFKAFFVATTSTSYRLILHVASTNASAWTLDTDNFQVGPQVQLSGAAVTDPVSYTPTFNGFGTVSTSSIWRAQSGQFLIGYGNFTAGTVAALEASLLLPTGLTIDTTKLPANERIVGRWTRNNASGSAVKSGPIIVDTVNNDRVKFSYDDYTSAVNPFVARLGNGIAATGDTIAVSFQVPIANWSSNTTMAERAVEEYAYNTATADSNDNYSFGYGSAGVQFGSFSTATRTKRVRFQTPIQPTDAVILEAKDGASAQWMPYGQTRYQSISTTTGMACSIINSTDVDVYFASAGYAGTVYSTSSAWSGVAGSDNFKWRVRKVSGGAVVGYPVGARNVVGDTTGTAVPQGFVGEQISATLSNVSLTSGVASNGGSISLGAGVWQVFYKGSVDYTSVATLTNARASISTTSATQHLPSQVQDGATDTTSARLLGTSVRYLVLSSTTTVYAVIQASFTTGVGVVSAAANSQFYAVRVG